MFKKTIAISIIGLIVGPILFGCSEKKSPLETNQDLNILTLESLYKEASKENSQAFSLSCNVGAVYKPMTAWSGVIRYKIVTLQGISGPCGTDRYAELNLSGARACVVLAIAEWNKKLKDNNLNAFRFVEDNSNAEVTITLGLNVNGGAGTMGGPGIGTDEVRFPPRCYMNSNSHFYNVILHELGHVLGLRHFPAKPANNLLLCGDQQDPESVMFTGNGISDGDLCTLRNCLYMPM